LQKKDAEIALKAQTTRDLLMNKKIFH